MLSSFLISQDFSKGSVDPTLFIRRNGNDLLLMSMIGKISFFLGLQISQSPRGIFINQSKYALESLKKYGFESCDQVDTPMVEKSKLDEDKERKAEFWAKATVHNHAIRFKMDNKKHIVNLESFRDMLHICPRVNGQTFAEPPFEEEIIAFIHFLGHSAVIRTLTDVKHKNHKKSNEMYYPRFTKVIIHHFMSKDPSILRRNKFGALLPIELTNEEIRNSNAYKEYYAIATGATPPKPKASVRMTRSSSDTSITPPTAAVGPRLTTSQKGKQVAKASKAKSLASLSEVAMTEAQQLKLVTKRSRQQTHISHASGSGANEGTGDADEGKDGDGDDDDNGDDGEKGYDDDDDDEDEDGEEGDDDDDDLEVVRDDDKGDEKDDEEEDGDDEEEYDEETRDEKSFDPILKTTKNNDDEGNGDEDLGLNVGGEEGHVKKEEEDELYRDVNINQGRGLQTTLEVEDSHVTLTLVNPDGQQQSSSVSSQFVTSMLNPTLDEDMESIFDTTSQMDAQTPTSVAPLPMNAPTMTPSTIATITITSQAPILPTTRMNKAVKVAVQIQSDHLCDEAQRENDEFLKTVDENMQKIIKEQTSYVVVADLSEMELKKILIEKIKGNKSIQRSDEQRNLYKALVEAYEPDNIILDTYRETVTLKRRRDDDADKDEEPSAAPDRGSKRRREGNEPESASAPMKTATRKEPVQTTCQMEEPSHPEFDTGAEDQPIVQSSQHLKWFSQQQKPPSLDRDWNKTVPDIHESIQPWISELANLVELEYHLEELFKATTDQVDWVNPKSQQYPHNLLKPLPLIPNNRGRRVIPFEHFINNDLEYLCGGALSRKYTTSITKTKAADYRYIKWIKDLVPRTMWIEEPIGYDKHALWEVSYWGRKCKQFYGFTVNRESAHDVYSKRRIIVVIELKIVEWHNYKYLDWITVRRDNDKLYKFKEGDFKRLRIQDIEDMLLLLRRVEDLQMGVKSYQKKLNLTKLDSYRSDLKRKEAYTAYSNPRGFIYQNKDKKNRLMRIDELHKFSDGTLTDVRTALDDCLKGIWMQYLPQSIWRKSDKDRAATMI
nr:hypothetical protein [Tanacetum cinerariifolium]